MKVEKAKEIHALIERRNFFQNILINLRNADPSTSFSVTFQLSRTTKNIMGHVDQIYQDFTGSGVSAEHYRQSLVKTIESLINQIDNQIKDFEL